jgi:hypothetical protein
MLSVARDLADLVAIAVAQTLTTERQAVGSSKSISSAAHLERSAISAFSSADNLAEIRNTVLDGPVKFKRLMGKDTGGC